MNLITEIEEKKHRFLIVDSYNSTLTEKLKKRLSKYDLNTFYSSKLPNKLDLYDYCFIINDKSAINHIYDKKHKKIILIFLNNEKASLSNSRYNLKNTKIIDLHGDVVREEDLEKILWFSFSTTEENYLKVILKKNRDNKKSIKPDLKNNFLPNYPYKKNFISIALFVLLIGYVAFLPLLLASSYYLYQSYIAIKSENFSLVKKQLAKSNHYLDLGKKFYRFSRPSLSLFSAALFPDNIIDINEKLEETLTEAIDLYGTFRELFSLTFSKSGGTTNKLSFDYEEIRKKITKLEDNLIFLNQKIPSKPEKLNQVKNELIRITDGLSKAKKLFSYFDDLLAKNSSKKYLLLFANNKELRPGGGFIGSFGTVRFNNYSMADLQIYDVYDADGQLIAHVDPPEAIKKYLNQPHWFLRDSGFEPDFYENYTTAKYFLDKEVGLKDFDGAILLTTSAIENILGAFDNIYLSDFNEKITQKNFYLKAQTYSEKDFFPGSIQKKSFLAALARQIIINLPNASLQKIMSGINKSLDEKQLVLFFENQDLQKIVDSYYWSGRLIKPNCAATVENCLVDFLFPVDANLGVNKANFFVSRYISSKIIINYEGKINHEVTIQFKNDSPADVFPGGYYKNYFRILIPNNTKVKQILKDDVIIDEHDESDGEVKSVGFFFEVPPKKTTTIKIVYELNNKLKKGKGVYQLIVQKQIGSSNNDFDLNLVLPKNIYLINQNFTPLVKDGKIIYNTNLTADKIFFIELIKE